MIQYCDICKIQTTNFYNHKLSNKHLINAGYIDPPRVLSELEIKAILLEKAEKRKMKDKLYSEKTVYCDACDVYIKNPRMFGKHLSTKKHKRNIDQKINDDDMIDIIDTNIIIKKI